MRVDSPAAGMGLDGHSHVIEVLQASARTLQIVWDMKTRRWFILFVAVCAVSSSAVAEQLSNRIDDALTIGVTVDPTCTVAITPGKREPEEAIRLACRNLRENQPQPLLLEAEQRDGHDVVLIRF
jgi:hypothetical protein